MQSHDTVDSANLARSRRTLWLLLLVCAAPIIASYVAYLFWAPTGRVNYGELLELRPMPETSLSATDGSALWEFDTNREFETVNGVKAAGASINQAGPTVADGMVYVSSGYGALGGRPGNVLLAFGVE